MYHYYKHREIDFKKWDKCINHSLNGTVYALSEYLNITAPYWDAIIKKEHEEYAVVLPIPIFKKFGIRYVKQPDFTNELGIFHLKKISIADFIKIEEILLSKFQLISSYVFNASNSVYLDELFSSFKKKKVTHYKIELARDYQCIYDSFSKSRKKHIRRALEKNIAVDCSKNIEELISLFKEYTAGKIYGGVSENQYRKLKNLHTLYNKEGSGRLYYAKIMDETISGAFTITYKEKIVDIFSASNDKGKQNSAESVIINQIIKENFQTHQYLELANAGSEGIRFFKESFKPVTSVCVVVSINQLFYLFNALKTIRKILIIKSLAIKRFLKKSGETI